MSPFTSAQDGVILCLTQDGRSVTGTRVLAAGRPVVVGAVAGAVVVVVGGVEEVALAPVAVTQQGVTLGRTAAEWHGDGVAVGVASAHRLTPVASTHDIQSYLLINKIGGKSAEKVNLVDMTGVDWNQIMLHLKDMGMIYGRLMGTEARVTY